MSVNYSDLRCIPSLKVDNLWKWVEYVCDVKGPGSTWIFRGQARAEWSIKSSFERTWYDSIYKTDSETKRALPAEIIETFMEALLRACRICDSKDQPMVSLTDVMSGRETFGSVKLVRFVFSAELRCEARALLSAANISPRTMYPDLEGVARSLKGDYRLG